MAKLTPEQIAAAAHEAGFRGEALAEIVAIALAESGGNPRALNPRGEYSVGLTQINMRAHGSRFGSEQDLYDPVQNMRAAFQLSRGGQNFRPWSVHRSSPSRTSGASDRFLSVARQAAGVAAEGGVGVPGGDELDTSPRRRTEQLWSHFLSSMSEQIKSGQGTETPVQLLSMLRGLGAPLTEDEEEFPVDIPPVVQRPASKQVI